MAGRWIEAPLAEPVPVSPDREYLLIPDVVREHMEAEDARAEEVARRFYLNDYVEASATNRPDVVRFLVVDAAPEVIF